MNQLSRFGQETGLSYIAVFSVVLCGRKGPQALYCQTTLREHRDLRASFSPSWKTAEPTVKCGRARVRRKKSSHGVHGVHRDTEAFLAIDRTMINSRRVVSGVFFVRIPSSPQSLSSSSSCSCPVFERHRPTEIASGDGREWTKLSASDGRQGCLSYIAAFVV